MGEAGSDKPKAEGERTAPEMDRRTGSDRRQQGERRKDEVQVPVNRRSGTDRRKTTRRTRRSINQYDMDADTLEFVNAITRFKERTGRAFPTWSEVLEIVRELGYEKRE